MKKIILMLLLTFISKSHSSNGEKFSSIYIDKKNNVHIVFLDGRDEKISKNGHAENATLAPDKHSAAWLVLNTWIAEGDVAPGASLLAIYRNNKVRHIKCEPFIRDYWFWLGGKQVAIDCGGRHFAGTLMLYDTESLKNMDAIFQADIPEDKRPAWSRPENNADFDAVQ
ncbi:hypothetical protein [Janthinobacterium sp. RB2R34]|uniref:hypothetical protein n=1 Tax=Janthinobacterium sp. RB2R34 TaxID=3424193 RepID=UPI003F25CC43